MSCGEQARELQETERPIEGRAAGSGRTRKTSGSVAGEAAVRRLSTMYVRRVRRRHASSDAPRPLGARPISPRGRRSIPAACRRACAPWTRRASSRGAKGSRVWDADGNEYVDYNNAFGPIILGHAHPASRRQGPRDAPADRHHRPRRDRARDPARRAAHGARSLDREGAVREQRLRGDVPRHPRQPRASRIAA